MPSKIREWPRYCRKVYWTKMVQNGPNDHVGPNDLIPNWILAFARPKWTKMVHFGLKRSILVHLGPPTVPRPPPKNGPGAAQGGRQKEFDLVFPFWSLFGHFFWRLCHFFSQFLCDSFCRTLFAAGRIFHSYFLGGRPKAIFSYIFRISGQRSEHPSLAGGQGHNTLSIKWQQLYT